MCNGERSLQDLVSRVIDNKDQEIEDKEKDYLTHPFVNSRPQVVICLLDAILVNSRFIRNDKPEELQRI